MRQIGGRSVVGSCNVLNCVKLLLILEFLKLLFLVYIILTGYLCDITDCSMQLCLFEI